MTGIGAREAGVENIDTDTVTGSETTKADGEGITGLVHLQENAIARDAGIEGRRLGQGLPTSEGTAIGHEARTRQETMTMSGGGDTTSKIAQDHGNGEEMHTLRAGRVLMITTTDLGSGSEEGVKRSGRTTTTGLHTQLIPNVSILNLSRVVWPGADMMPSFFLQFLSLYFLYVLLAVIWVEC